MIQKLTHITILVNDIDEALKFYVEKFGFDVHTDAVMPNGTRWTTVCPKGQKDMEFALIKAATPQESERVGRQVGEGCMGCLHTDNCKETYEELKSRGVITLGEPVEEPWGIGVVIADLYGNKFYLNEPKQCEQ